MEIALVLLISFLLCGLSAWFGYKLGVFISRNEFERISREPIAGQTVNVRGVGDVFILGRGHYDADENGVIDDDEEYIDYISQHILNGRFPSELNENELDENTVSVPVKQFVLQCDFVRAQIF